MPAGDKLKPKSTREHLLSIYGYITGIKKDMKHMHEGIHDLGGKIDKIYWVVLGTVGAVSLLEHQLHPSLLEGFVRFFCLLSTREEALNSAQTVIGV